MPKVRLNVTHTHAGVVYPAGHLIEVDDHTARWLSERNIATPARAVAPPIPTDTTAPAKPASADPATPGSTSRSSKSTQE